MTEPYFFDSYALIEVVMGNSNYLKYKGSKIVLTKLNLFEVYYSLIRQGYVDLAEIFLETYEVYVIDFDNQTIKNAANFRLNYKKQNLSMTDCIGYVLAKKLNVKFLTGDKEFNDMENVEFVK